ncbi:MAG: division/cell wall cluster transcriptional repressor MraZ [Myxococcales bacterium]|nr:division/cell wall cluster transcriptional repressor MraZ [Myxococcales bacterium]
MSVRFRGEHWQRIDDKGRLSVPSAWRGALDAFGDGRLVLAKSVTAPCLTGYTMAEWEAFEDKLRALPQSLPVVQSLLRFQVAGSHVVEPDTHGRVLVPPALRAHAGLSGPGAVVMASQVARFEVWAADRWRIEIARVEAALPQLRDELAAHGL